MRSLLFFLNPSCSALSTTTNCQTTDNDDGDDGKIAAIMASRFIFMPIIAAGLLLTGAKAKLIPYDKLVWFVLLMEG